MTALDDIKVHVKIKISALWVSVMFCYIYGDYFGLYKPGALQGMLSGKMGPLGPTTQGILLGTSAMMAIPVARYGRAKAAFSATSGWKQWPIRHTYPPSPPRASND